MFSLDNTAAFQAALDAAGQSNSTTSIVFAPKGQYLFTGSITFPKSVSLEGSYRSVPSHSYRKAVLPPLHFTRRSVLISRFNFRRRIAKRSTSRWNHSASHRKQGQRFGNALHYNDRRLHPEGIGRVLRRPGPVGDSGSVPFYSRYERQQSCSGGCGAGQPVQWRFCRCCPPPLPCKNPRPAAEHGNFR